MAFVAGAITSKLTLDRSKFSASMKAVRKQTKSLGGWVKKNSGQFKAMGLAAAAAGAAVLLVFKKMVKQYVETGDMIHKMAIRTGFAAETLSELAYAADISGADINMLEKGVKKMSKTIVDASYGLETYLRVFRGLGIEIEDIMKLSPEQQFLKLGAAIAAMENQTLKTAAAVDIFGRAGTMLLPLFEEGEEGMAKLREEAHRLGIIFTEETAASAAALKDAQTALTGSVKGLSIAILNDLIPVLTDVTKEFTNWFVDTRKDAASWTEALLKFFKAIAQGIEGMMLAWHGFQVLVFEGAALITKHLGKQVSIMVKMLLLMERLPLVGKKLIPVTDELVDLWKDLDYVTEGYNESAEEQIDRLTEIIIGFDKFFAVLDRVGAGLKKSKEDMKTLGGTITESVLPPARALGDVFENMVGAALPAARKLSDLFKHVATEMESDVFKIGKSWEEVFWEIYQAASQFTSALGGLFAQMSENEIAVIEKNYEARKAAIENSLLDEEQKAKAMERLDKQFEMKRKKAIRAQAKRTKAVALMDAIVGTAAAVVQAMRAPFPLSLILPIIIGAMGAAQIALIAAQPLPSLQKGGRIGEAGIVGEGGPELFFPATPGTIVPLRTEATALPQATISIQIMGSLISTTGVARADLERAGNTLLDVIEKQARRRGYTLNGS